MMKIATTIGKFLLSATTVVFLMYAEKLAEVLENIMYCLC